MISRNDMWMAALFAAVAGAIFYPFAAIGVDAHHDGITLKPALDVLSGQVLFRDTFSQYGPLTTYLQAMALAIKPTLLSLRVFTVFAYAGSLFFLYLAWRALLPRILSFVASLLFIVYAPFYDPEWAMLPWSSALALFFQAIAILAFVRIVAGDRSAGWAWVLGSACACTLWCRQPVGIILTGSVVVIAIALHITGWRHPSGPSWRIWARIAVGFGGITILIVGHLVINSALGDWWEQNIVWPRRWAGADQHHYLFFFHSSQYLSLANGLGLFASLIAGFAPAISRCAWPRLPRWVDFVWIGILMVGYFAFARVFTRTWLLVPTGGWGIVIFGLIFLQALWAVVPYNWSGNKSRPSEYYTLATFAGLALGSVAQIFPVPCPNHIYWSIAPGFGLFLYSCWRWTKSSEWACSLIMVILLLPACYDKYQWGKYTLRQPSITLESPALLRGMRASPDKARALCRIDITLQSLLTENPDRPGLLYGDDALYLTWFGNRANPSPYYVNWSGLLSKSDRLKRLTFLVEKQPILLLHQQKEDEMYKLLQAMNYQIVEHEPALALWLAIPIPPQAIANTLPRRP